MMQSAGPSMTGPVTCKGVAAKWMEGAHLAYPVIVTRCERVCLAPDGLLSQRRRSETSRRFHRRIALLQLYPQLVAPAHTQGQTSGDQVDQEERTRLVDFASQAHPMHAS